MVTLELLAMQERRGKVIIYRCDLCKTTEIPRGNQLKLGSVQEVNKEEMLFWDLCSNCQQKIKDQLGPGRKYA